MEALKNLVNDFNTPTGGGASFLCHDEPLVKLSRYAEDCKGVDVLINLDRAERKDEVKNGEDMAFAKSVRNRIDTLDGKLSKAADVVYFFVVDRDADVAVSLGGGDQRAREKGEYWIRSAARFWSEMVSTFLAGMELIRYGREVTGGRRGG